MEINSWRKSCKYFSQAFETAPTEIVKNQVWMLGLPSLKLLLPGERQVQPSPEICIWHNAGSDQENEIQNGHNIKLYTDDEK